MSHITDSSISATSTLPVLRQFRIIYGTMRQHFHTVEESCGLTGTQMWVLREVQRHPGIGVSELAGLLGIHQSTCSIMVDKLVVQHFLAKTRHPVDRRRVGLTLAEKGSVALDHLPGPAEGVLPEALEALPETTRAALQQHLHTLIQHLAGAQESYGCLPLAGMLDRAEITGAKNNHQETL